MKIENEIYIFLILILYACPLYTTGDAMIILAHLTKRVIIMWGNVMTWYTSLSVVVAARKLSSLEPNLVGMFIG